MEERTSLSDLAQFLNADTSAHGKSLESYLQAWRNAVPADQKEFVRQVGLLFELQLK